MLDIERIEALAKALDGSPVTELVLVEDETEIRFSRAPTAATPAGGSGANSSGIGEPVPREHLIVARRVGVYHRPQRPVHPGDRIEAGEIVGFIEAMRIVNEVVADDSGTVMQVYVEDGNPVEYGQELILLRGTASETGD